MGNPLLPWGGGESAENIAGDLQKFAGIESKTYDHYAKKMTQSKIFQKLSLTFPK